MAEECPVCEAQKKSREENTVKLKKLQVDPEEGKKL